MSIEIWNMVCSRKAYYEINVVSSVLEAFMKEMMGGDCCLVCYML